MGELEYAITQIDLRLSGQGVKEETNEWTNDFKQFILVKTEVEEVNPVNESTSNGDIQVQQQDFLQYIGKKLSDPLSQEDEDETKDGESYVVYGDSDEDT